jgi:hypothetical protein
LLEALELVGVPSGPDILYATNREFPDAYQGKFFEEQVSLAEATLDHGLLVG